MPSISAYRKTSALVDRAELSEIDLEQETESLRKMACKLITDAATPPADKIAVVRDLLRREWDGLPLDRFLACIERELKWSAGRRCRRI